MTQVRDWGGGAGGRGGATLDAARWHLLMLYTDLAPWFKFANVCAYELSSWCHLSLASTGQLHPLSPQTTPTMREKRKGEKMAKREGNQLTDM